MLDYIICQCLSGNHWLGKEFSGICRISSNSSLLFRPFPILVPSFHSPPFLFVSFLTPPLPLFIPISFFLFFLLPFLFPNFPLSLSTGLGQSPNERTTRVFLKFNMQFSALWCILASNVRVFSFQFHLNLSEKFCQCWEKLWRGNPLKYAADIVDISDGGNYGFVFTWFWWFTNTKWTDYVQSAFYRVWM